MSNNNRVTTNSLITLISTAALLTTLPAQAYRDFTTRFSLMYPASESLNNAQPDGCQLCHKRADGRGGLNPYGLDWLDAWPNDNPTYDQLEQAFVAVEGLNSDDDPTLSSNLAEISAGTQPGWAEGDAAPGINGDLDPTIEEQPPVADANGPYTGTAGVPLLLDASGSWDPNDNIATYEWHFGDGTAVTVNTATVDHTYATDGDYEVTLTVTDTTGLDDSDTTMANIETLADYDADGVPDNQDNCIEDANGPLIPDAGGNSQLDTDGDGYGNLCDPDFDNNLNIDFADLARLKSVFFTADPDADLDGNGRVDFADLAILKSMFFGSPGPSGLAP